MQQLLYDFFAEFHNIQIKDIDNTEIALALGADVPVFVHKKVVMLQELETY